MRFTGPCKPPFSLTGERIGTRSEDTFVHSHECTYAREVVSMTGDVSVNSRYRRRRESSHWCPFG